MKVSKKKSKRKESLSRRIFLVCNTIFLIIFALICLVPFINLLAISLSDSNAVDAGNVALTPVGFNFTAYEYLIQKKEFWDAFKISVDRVVLGTIISLAINILAAYPLSRPNKYFKGRKFYVVILIITMFFNGGIVPNFIIISKLGIMNTILALILPTAMNAWNIVLLVSFFKEVPNELVEAAEIDGASQWQILFRVVLPISLPALATVTLFTAVAHWNNWFDGYMYMNSDNYPLQTYIYDLINKVNQLSNMNLSEAEREALSNLPGKTLRSAQTFIAMLPIMLVYPFVQKYFIKGLTQGGVKE